MVVNEIRSAVIDTINFIIPPFVKLIITLYLASFVTYNHLTDFYFKKILASISNVNIDAVKEIIDKLYLSSIVPILFILILISFAYLINRLIDFFSSFIPFSFSNTSQLVNHYSILYVWKYFKDIDDVYNLELRLNQIFGTIKKEDDLINFESLEYLTRKKNTEFSYYNFIQFLFVVSIVFYIMANRTLNLNLNSARLFITLTLLIFTAIVILARISDYFFGIEQNKLMIVENHLKREKGFLPNYYEIDKEILERIESGKKYNSKWWWVSFGYKLGWIKMFKHYNFRYPFYRYFQERRAKNILNK